MNMNDDYAEVSVKGNYRKYTAQSRIIGVSILVFGFLFSYLFIVMIAQGSMSISSLVLAVYICVGIPYSIHCMLPKQIEYDYLYVGSEIEIDAVKNQSKRTHKMTIQMQQVKCIAPDESQALLGYEGKGSLKVKDFTDGDKNKKRYALIMEDNVNLYKILLEPSEHMLHLLKLHNKDIFYAE